MKTTFTSPSIMVVESGQALPSSLYLWLDRIGLEVLGPTDDLFDAYRLARDRRPRLAIIDKRIGTNCRTHIHSALALFQVVCFDLSASVCRRRQGLSVIENAIATAYGSDLRDGTVASSPSRQPGEWVSMSRVDRTPLRAHV